MAARRRRGGRSSGRKKQNVEWANASIVAPVLMTTATVFAELVPDAMSGLTLAPDFLIKRIVGSFMIRPQSGSSGSSQIGLAIFRSVHDQNGSRQTSLDPLSTDVDSGSLDILWQKQFQPDFGGPLDATALDLAVNIEIDLKTRGSLRKLNKQHGLTLAHQANVASRLEITFRLRILSALSAP